jgi:hypothetical protein
MFDLGSKDFAGFTAAHFDAFEERKWSSHRFNLERMASEASLKALMKAIAPGLKQAADDLEWEGTSASPSIINGKQVDSLCQYLTRAPSEMNAIKKVVDKEISLAASINHSNALHGFAFPGLRLHEGGLDIGLWLHSHAVLDKRNLAAGIADPIERTQLPILLDNLGDEAQVVLDGEQLRVDEWFASPSLDKVSGWFSICNRLGRDSELISSGDHIEELTNLLLPYMGLFRFIAWSSTNDRLQLSRQLKEERKERVRRRSGFAAGDSVKVIEGLLSGKLGKVTGVDTKGRVKVQIGHIAIDIKPAMLKRA